MTAANAPRRRLALSGGSVLVLAAALALANGAAAAALAAAASDAAAGPREETEVQQVIVTAPTNHASIVAPVRGSLTETEPQAVITRQFIEESAPRFGDFSTIAAFAPSMAATSNPNGAGSSDGSKLTMRGFGDGSYNITYDGIAWGDTNGPSHHGTAFFPRSTIGGVIIDRGPGGATDLGQANFGGSVNLLSLPLEAERGLTQVGTVGSFGAWQSVTTLQSGEVGALHGARFLANFQEEGSDGYLSYSRTHGTTQMFKASVPLTDHITITALYTHTGYFYNKSDIGDASVAQTSMFGETFSLGNNPALSDYYGYNWVKKDTNFGYIRLQADLGAGWSFNDTLYNYDYDNKTLSSQNNLANPPYVVTLTPGATYPAPGKGYNASLQTPGIPGYNKKNEYWVTGDIAKFTKDFSFGEFTVGALFEKARTLRYIEDIDLLTGLTDYREKAATTAGSSGTYVQTPLNIQYFEWSGWTQYQVFGQFEWKPTSRLTITPGVKFVHFDLFVNAPEEKVSIGIQPLYVDQVYTKTLPFLTVHYKLSDNWAIYAQYAQGFLVPNISNLYVANTAETKLVPQESTNYQLGTVLNFNKFTFDGDLYYIDFKNKIQSFADIVTGQSYDTNSGGAYYQGIEVQGAYVLPYGASVFANYSLNNAIGKDNAANPLYNGHQLTGAPEWTAALGVRLHRENLFRTDDSFILTLNDKWIGPQYVTNATCSSAPGGVCVSGAKLTPVTGRLQTINEADLSATYRLGRYSIEGQVLNLFDGRALTAAKGSALIAGTTLWAQTIAEGGANNALEYQVPVNFQITVKAKF